MVVSSRRDGHVVYSISVPEVRDLLLAGRRILAQLAASQIDLGELIEREAASAPGGD